MKEKEIDDFDEMTLAPDCLKNMIRLAEINLELLHSLVLDQILNHNFDRQEILNRLNGFIRDSLHTRVAKKYVKPYLPSDRLRAMREGGLISEEDFNKAKSRFDELDKIHLKEMEEERMKLDGKGIVDHEEK